MRGHWFLPLLLGRIFILTLQPFTAAQKTYNVTVGGINLDSEEIVLFDPQYVVRLRLFIINFLVLKSVCTDGGPWRHHPFHYEAIQSFPGAVYMGETLRVERARV